MFELEAVPQSWTLQVQIGLKIVLYNNNLLSIDNCDLLPSIHLAQLDSKLFSLDEYVLSPI